MGDTTVVNLGMIRWISHLTLLGCLCMTSVGCTGLAGLDSTRNAIGQPLPIASENADFPIDSSLNSHATDPAVGPGYSQESCHSGETCLSGLNCYSDETVVSCSDSCTPHPGSGVRMRDTQEYIFDGGDSDPAVVVRKDWTAAGIDVTDTVAYYETEHGKVCVQPSNRVAVYSPRFGSVRQVIGAELAGNALAPGRVHVSAEPVQLEERNLAARVDLATGPLTRKQIQQLDRFREEANLIHFQSVVPPVPISEAARLLINVDVSTSDLAQNRENSVVAQRNANVETLYLPESLTVILDGQPAAVVTSSKQPAETFVYELPDKCSLKITKSVSHTLAGSGDVVRFTIRFENFGPNKLGNVAIVDSLSPRLEYIGDSQTSSLDAWFSTAPNNAGSQELRWTLRQQLESNQGGVISFDCLVR